ncbi:hypothetical protein A2U01_0059798, partial [Trifolium medium]|nr:hypothetical protein [Trifolium medium]
MIGRDDYGIASETKEPPPSPCAPLRSSNDIRTIESGKIELDVANLKGLWRWRWRRSGRRTGDGRSQLKSSN